MAEANDWLERYRQFWEVRYEHLDALLAQIVEQTRTSRVPDPGAAR